MDSQREEKNISIKQLNISKDFVDMSSKKYWENYHELYMEMSLVLRKNIEKTLEKFIILYFPSIPKDVLLYLVENFNIFKENNGKQEIASLPDLKVYDIEGLSNREKLDFYRLRSEIYFLLKKGSLNFEDYEAKLSQASKLNHKDWDLLGFKGTFLALKALCKEEELAYLEDFIQRWNFPNDKFYKNFLQLLERTDVSDEIFEDISREHLPKYFSNFLKGYLYYKSKDFDRAYDIWLGSNEKNPLVSVEKRYISRIYEYLSDNLIDYLRQEGVLKGYVSIPVTLKDIIRRRDFSYDLKNWKDAIRFDLILQNPQLKQDALDYLRKNYRLLPKEVVSYIVSKVPIIPYENVSAQEYEEIVNLPRLNFQNPNISKDVAEEFYLKRYNYYKNCCNRKYIDDYYSLKEYGFDYSTEVIRVGELLGEEIFKKKPFDFTKAIKKIEELGMFQDNLTIDFYKRYIDAYNNGEMTLETLREMENIDFQDLVMGEELYNFIMANSYRIAGEKEKFNFYLKKLPEDLKRKFKVKLPLKKGFFKRLFKK